MRGRYRKDGNGRSWWATAVFTAPSLGNRKTNLWLDGGPPVAKASLLLRSVTQYSGEQQLEQYQSVGTSPSLNMKHPGSQCQASVSLVNLVAGVI